MAWIYTISIDHTCDARICIMHKNVPAVIAGITAAVSGEGINIENMANGSKGNFAYTVVEIIGDIPEVIIEKLSAMDEIIRINVIR